MSGSENPVNQRVSPANFKIGSVVANRKIPGNMPHEPLLGHITGFAQSAYGEVILKVTWCNGKESTIHPGNAILNPKEWPPAWSEERALNELRKREASAR